MPLSVVVLVADECASFDAVGIALPNQDDGAEVGETWDSRVSTTAAVEKEEGESAADATSGKAPAAGSGDIATALASDPAPDTHSDSIASSPTASPTDPGALGDRLRETLDHVGGLLDGLSLSGQQ